MRGHIAKKGNHYYTVVYEGINPATGKPRHRWHTAGETRKGTVFRNVANIADPPSISRSGRSMNVWTGNQLRTFLEAIAEHELYGLYFLAATTDMRRGEIADLRWRNIDLDAARLTVNQQIVSVEYQLIEDGLQPPPHRPRRANHRHAATTPTPPTRGADGERETGRRRLRVRQVRRLTGPARPSNAS